MHIEVTIPSMGESITSGVLSCWHVSDGDIVQTGQLLYDLETDKVSSEGTAEKAGKITFKVVAGTEVSIGQIVAMIDTSVAPAAVTKTPEPVAPAKIAEAVLSPAARRHAEETGVPTSSLTGTGKDGRITKGDILSAHKPATTTPTERTTRTKMTPMRRKIAERLVMAQSQAAMLTTFNEVNMQAIMAIRKQHQDAFVAKHGVKLGFMSFFVKAVVRALQKVPEVNAMIDGDSIIQNHYYDIGIAVGGAKGLVVPVVRNCDQLSLADIERAIIGYAKKAKEGKLSLDDMQGGVFTISNGGVYGSVLSTPILNPPQSGILGMHAIQERAVVEHGTIVIRPMMHLALTYDHRIVDGREAVTFLIKVKELLEHPAADFMQTFLGL